MRTERLACGLLVLGWFAFLAVPRASAATESPALFGVVVGSNNPGDTGLATLKYADDDAFRNYEVLRMLGANVELLVDPDVRTRDRHRADAERPDGGVDMLRPTADSAGRTRRPTAANLKAALRETFARVAAARAKGRKTEFFFWYSGHGSRRETTGVLLLEDGDVFSRTDLYDLVLGASPANFNHLFIDACGAGLFVSSRGGGSDQDGSIRQHDEILSPYLSGESLSRFRNVGVLFAATKDGSVHESSQHEGGVFSFELRAALLNAADANGDRRVTYLEAYAFLAAANQEVKTDAARMEIVPRIRQQDLDRVLADWSGGQPTSALHLPGGAGRHVRISDDRGVPLLETNKDVRDAAVLILPPRPAMTLHLLPLSPQDASERVLDMGPVLGVVNLESVLRDKEPTEVTARGGDIALQLRRGLFQVPYGRVFYLGVAAATTPRGALLATLDPEAPRQGSERSELRPLRVWSYGLLATGAAAALAAGFFWNASQNAYDEYTGATSEQDRQHWKAVTRRWDWGTTLSLVGAGAAGLAGGTLLVLDLRRGPRGSTAGGAAVMLSLTF
jgi:hypothetical protein